MRSTLLCLALVAAPLPALASHGNGHGNGHDDDNDGYPFPADCDDSDPSVHPHAPEIPDNGIDEDCWKGDVSLTDAVVINEVLYDPPGGSAGDANNDGTRSASADEFVEIVNTSKRAIDLSGVLLWDDDSLNDPEHGTYGVPNHLVPAGTIVAPGQALVVFGGGSPSGTFGGAVVQTSTSGNLNLNNSGDILFVQDAGGTTRLTFDVEPLSNNPDESYTRFPDLVGQFEQHADSSPRLFSPGTKVDLTAFDAPVAGTGSFTYVDDEQSDKPLPVYYHLPSSLCASTPIVLLFHGAGRVAESTRDAWISAADTHGFAVFAPGFSDTSFEGVSGYQLGNVFDDGDAPTAATLNEDEEWTFSLVEPLFDEIRDEIGSNQSVFHAWGHSGGAQFLHRLALFDADLPFGTVIAANSGWYTAPDRLVSFPYGLGVTPIVNEPADWFGVDLVVHIGSDDTDPNTASLRHTPEADLQGLNRYDRAYWFVAESEAAALLEAEPFTWSLVEVPGVGHDEDGMAAFAGTWLANRLGL